MSVDIAGVKYVVCVAVIYSSMHFRKDRPCLHHALLKICIVENTRIHA